LRSFEHAKSSAAASSEITLYISSCGNAEWLSNVSMAWGGCIRRDDQERCPEGASRDLITMTSEYCKEISLESSASIRSCLVPDHHVESSNSPPRLDDTFTNHVLYLAVSRLGNAHIYVLIHCQLWRCISHLYLSANVHFLCYCVRAYHRYPFAALSIVELPRSY